MQNPVRGSLATQYRRGKAFEYRSRDHLRKQGYFVIQAGGSKGVADLIAIRPGAVLFVQAKTNGLLGFQEWNLLYETAIRVGAVPLLVSRDEKRRLVYQRLLAPKVFRSRTRPMELFTP